MKYVAVAAALAGVAAAQSQCLSVAASVPSCGVECISSAGSVVGCAQTDFACACSSSQNAAIASLAQGCVIDACMGVETALMVQSAAAAVCSCASSAGSDSPSSADASATATATDDGDGDDDSSSVVATDTAVMTSGAAGGGMTSGADETMASATAIETTPPISTAGAATVVGSVGGVMGGLLAMIALL